MDVWEGEDGKEEKGCRSGDPTDPYHEVQMK